ncbi:ATP-binding protein [Mycolicibacterium confluentis]|uniref:ATPase AAA n=1 Tax=Mycolicibacterium confluentis TaxID=28047 RepID=A0A7I7Y0G7_9MYCO|nr:ATP-binding protein [Mycolicibacterium confluentis]MCV7319629.1 AAA family ATPase [Mycolicibacterium confluentis]ORV34233.1 AAA family ATPase [Mycolicibacterium confluentis]BBZ34653.1 ATPase AAA [Mycolicibacterium confluentis]
MAQEALIREIEAAVNRAPDVVELRLHLAELLATDGRYAEALTHCSTVLSQDAANRTALVLLQRCTAALAAPTDEKAPPPVEFDWRAAEEQVAEIIEPEFIEVEHAGAGISDADYDVVQRPDVRLADVAGMADVKRQLDLALLGPMRNPEVARAFNLSARGGLLLYGPPGCGKTFLARAVSGEIGASFYPVAISDVLDLWLGNSERALHNIFEAARRNAPCVLFFDEMDALGLRRSSLSNSSALRVVVNALLAELDSATSDNEGVYVIGATNMPWDIDPALRRPGRLDRMIFVSLPDAEARAEIVRLHLRDRPVTAIDLGSVVARTEGYSGADLAQVCATATQLAMADSVRTGQVRPVSMPDIDAGLAQTRPSAGPWFDVARNVIEFGNSDGSYDDLAKYLRRKKFR